MMKDKKLTKLQVINTSGYYLTEWDSNLVDIIHPTIPINFLSVIYPLPIYLQCKNQKNGQLRELAILAQHFSKIAF